MERFSAYLFITPTMNAAASHSAALLDSTHGQPKVLVVDDQPLHMQLMVQTLAEDYQLYMATHGEQALSLCRSDAPDLVLLDIQMPGVDGFAVCKALQADPKTASIPIIFVTARADAGQETHGLSLGAVDFIAKPINPAVLRARVRTHLTLKFQSDMLKKLVLLDGLSGVFNRRYFDQQLASEWARCARNKQALTLVLIDIDHFSAYNARYGHQAGDDCLRLIAVALKAVLRRPADLVARFAGEEFVCLLPDTSASEARKLANAMAQRVREMGGMAPGTAALQHLSISIGLASCAPQHANTASTADALLQEAVVQLAHAKASGPGQIRSKALESAAAA
jgi:diguanylate cyclase (GGDEF)-like protein